LGARGDIPQRHPIHEVILDESAHHPD